MALPFATLAQVEKAIKENSKSDSKPSSSIIELQHSDGILATSDEVVDRVQDSNTVYWNLDKTYRRGDIDKIIVHSDEYSSEYIRFPLEPILYYKNQYAPTSVLKLEVALMIEPIDIFFCSDYLCEPITDASSDCFGIILYRDKAWEFIIPVTRVTDNETGDSIVSPLNLDEEVCFMPHAVTVAPYYGDDAPILNKIAQGMLRLNYQDSLEYAPFGLSSLCALFSIMNTEDFTTYFLEGQQE